MLRTYLVLALYVFASLAQQNQVSFPQDWLFPERLTTWRQTKKGQKPPCNSVTCGFDNSVYDKAALSLSWPGSFCSQNGKCNADYSYWSGQTFGIHGYWPSKSNRDCTGQQLCPDPNCAYDYFLGARASSDLIADLETDLDTYWPQYGIRNQDNFRSDEWNKHGVCYLKRISELYPGKYTQAEILRYYFTSAIQKAKQFSRVPQPSYSSKQQLGESIGLNDTRNFFVNCQARKNKECQVKEIHICYNLVNPTEEKLTDCYFYRKGQAIGPHERPIDEDYKSYTFLNHKLSHQNHRHRRSQSQDL